MAEVQKIVSLKQLGFSLTEITDLLSSKSASLPKILKAQLETLKAEKDRVERAIKSLNLAIRTLQDGDDLDIPTLTKLIRMTTMSETIKKDMAKVKAKYFPKETLEAFEKRSVSEADQIKYNTRWKKLLARARDLLGSDPKSPEVQALGHECKDLIGVFTQGNPDAEAGLGRMYSNLDEWGAKHAEAMFGMPLEDFKRVQKFLQEARMARQS